MATYTLPPIVDYSYPAFVDSIALPISYPIDFISNPGVTVKFEYKVIHNESNAVTTGFSSNQYSSGGFWPVAVTIPITAFEESGAGIYKIQLRFYVNANDYSEWSSICYTKKLNNAPTVYISELDRENVEYIIVNDSPVFTGVYNSDEEEPFEYRFSLYYATNNTNCISSTGWKKHVAGQNYHYGQFPVLLEDFTNYKIIYEVKTVNGYNTQISCTRNFLTAFYEIQDDIGLQIVTSNDYENGVINIKISGDQMFAGNLMLRRASEKTNYQVWEDIQYLQVLNEQPNIVYNDFTIEHGVYYQYGVQVIEKVGQTEQRSNLIKSKKIMAEFEDIFLASNNEQIKIKFNPKISNFKRNLLEQKQDTIGNQYPYIMKNGNSNYFSFSLGGLISYFADTYNSNLFRESTQTQKTELDLLNVKTTNLSDRNVYNERQYREKIEKFLTNGEVKLFKSPTEGNMLIYLMQVSLTPNDTLSRMIYSFTSTAYEIGSIADANDLLKYKIFSKGQWTAIEKMGTRLRPISESIPVVANANIIDTLNERLNNENSTNPCIPLIENFQSITIETDKDINIKINGNNVATTITAQDGYSLPFGLIQIDSLVPVTSGTVHITGDALVSFQANTVYNISRDVNIGMTATTNIGQIIENNCTESYNLGDQVEQKYRLEKFFSFTYLKIRAYQGQEFTVTIDGNTYQIFDNQDRYFTEPIRECIINLPEGVDKIGFYADFIYNGYKNK